MILFETVVHKPLLLSPSFTVCLQGQGLSLDVIDVKSTCLKSRTLSATIQSTSAGPKGAGPPPLWL